MPLEYLTTETPGAASAKKSAGSITYLTGPKAEPPPSDKEAADAYVAGQLPDITDAQVLAAAQERNRPDPLGAAKGALSAAGHLLALPAEALYEQVTHPWSLNPLARNVVAAEGALKTMRGTGRMGMDVLHHGVTEPLEALNTIRQQKGLGEAAKAAAGLAAGQAMAHMRGSLLHDPVTQLAETHPEAATPILRRRLDAQREEIASDAKESKPGNSILSDIATAVTGNPAIGELVQPPEGSEKSQELAGTALDPLNWVAGPLEALTREALVKAAPKLVQRGAAPGKVLALQRAAAAREAAIRAGDEAAVRAATEAAEVARKEVIESFPNAPGAPGATWHDGTGTPPVMPEAKPPVIPVDTATPGKQFAQAAEAAGAPAAPGALQKAAGAAGKASEAVGGVLDAAASKAAELAEKYHGPVAALGALLGWMKGGPVGALVGEHLPKAVKGTAKAAENASRIGAALRAVAGADWASQFPVWEQLAKNPDAPQWLVKGATARVFGRLTAGQAVETGVRAAGDLGKAVGHGGVVGTAFAAADPAKSSEELGAGFGSGAAFGLGGGLMGLRAMSDQRRQLAMATESMRKASQWIKEGADPTVVARTPDAVMQQAVLMEHLFRGALPGGKGVSVHVTDAANFAKLAAGAGDAGNRVAFFDPNTGNVHINGEAVDVEGRGLHEVTHALMTSAVAANPAVLDTFRRLLGPQGLAKARAEYASKLGVNPASLPQDDLYIAGELYSEAVANQLRGLDLSRDTSKQEAKGSVRSFFTSPEILAAIQHPEVADLVRQQFEALREYRPAVDAAVERGLQVPLEQAGKHPALPLETQPDGRKGNDFVTVTPDNRVVANPPPVVRKKERNRAREVNAIFPPTEMPAPSGPDTDVRLHRTVSGLLSRTGTTLGDRFYNEAQTFSPEKKAMLKAIEAAIAGGQALAGWYQEIGATKGGWAENVREGLGNVEAQFKDFFPIAFTVTKNGNLLVQNYSLTAFERKANEWSQRKGPLSLELWNGNVADFRRDVQTYLANHAAGKPGADGIGETKRNIINAFMVGGNRTFEVANPLRPLIKGADREGIVRSYRADRLQSIEPSDVQGFAKPEYGKQVFNASAPVTRELGANRDFAKHPSDEAAREALDVAKRPRFGRARNLPEGTPVGLRIDIPAYRRTGNYVISVHEKAKGKSSVGDIIGYDTAARVANPTFFVNEGGAEGIAEGKTGKWPVATVEGTYLRDRSIPPDIDQWTPVGMDPKEHSYFYDKATDEPVVGGSEAVSVGNTVFVRDPVYGKREDFRYSAPVEGAPEPGFYSKLEQVVENEIKGEAMPAAQLKAIIRNRGVKAEELKWTNAEKIIDELAAQNGGKVPKQELMSRLVGARREMRMQEAAPAAPKWEVRDDQVTETYDSEEEAHAAREEWLDNLIDSAESEYRIEKDEEGRWQVVEGYGDPAHISGDSGRTYLSRGTAFRDERSAKEALREALANAMDEQVRVREVEPKEGDGPQFETYTLPGGENYREIAMVDPDIGRYETPHHDFGGASSDDLNARRVGHMRVKDRADAEGRPGLFIEELQSDRHQEGRKKGYKGDPGMEEAVEARARAREAAAAAEAAWRPAYDAMEEARRAMQARQVEVLRPHYRRLGVEDLGGLLRLVPHSEEARELRRTRLDIANQDPLYRELVDKMRRAEAEAVALEKPLQEARRAEAKADEIVSHRVPDAPFRKDWAVQLFKRALQDAVSRGKQWIGWTDGQTQVERYNLGGQVDSVSIGPMPGQDGAWQVVGRKNGDVLVDTVAGSYDKLADTVGKDLADKAVAAGGGTFSGADLRVGGGGMKGFYDAMLPKEVSKYVKQWGAKVEKAEMPLVGEADVMNGDEGGEDVVNIWKVEIPPAMAEAIKTRGQERYSPAVDQAVETLDRLGNKAASQVNPNQLPYPKNPDPESVALPARWGMVNRNIVGMPRSYGEVNGIVDRQVARLAKVVREHPEFAKESARFYLDMAESSMLMADAAFPAASGKDKWRSAELMLRFLALGSPRTGVSANATKSSYSASAAASDFTAGYKIGFGSQQLGAKGTLDAWKKGLPFDMHGEGVDNKVRNFYMNGLAELVDLARKEGDERSVAYLMDAAAAGLEMVKPGESVSPEKYPEVQRLLDGMATVDMWDMAAKGYAWPGWIANKKARPGEGKVPWVWSEEKYATKATVGSPTWTKIAAELSKQKGRKVTSPADLRYQEARALRVDGNRDWDAATWAERAKQPFGPETEITTFTNVSEEGLSPGGAGPLYDAQQAIDGLVADEINRRGMAPLFGKEKLLARNAQEILWALERLDNPIEANNDLALFGNTFKAFSRELNRLRTDEYGPVEKRPAKDLRGDTVLRAMEAAYASLANQDMPLEVVSAGTSPEARSIQHAIERLRQAGVETPEVEVTRAVADGLHEFLTRAADRHGIDLTVDSVSVGHGGYTAHGAPSVSPNMVMRLRGDPAETRNLLEVLSRALDQDGGNIFRRPTIREINTPTTKFNTVVTFATGHMTPEQKTAFFMDLNALKDSEGNSFFTGFTETADGMAIGDQFYGGDLTAQIEEKRMEVLRAMRKHGVPNFWTDSVIIETASRNHPEPEGLREQPFAKEVMEEVRRRIQTAGERASGNFPQTLDEEGRAVRRLEEGKTTGFPGKTALTRYFVDARAAIDAAMLRGIMDEAKGEKLKEALTEVEKLRLPEITEQAAQQAQERAKAKALEERRKVRLKALKEKRRAAEEAEKAARQKVLEERKSLRATVK